MSNLKKRFITLAGIACLGMTILLSPVTTLTAEAALPGGEVVSPNADSISYRFKIEDGKLYRRLYNYTTAEWIGDWEYVCEA